MKEYETNVEENRKGRALYNSLANTMKAIYLVLLVGILLISVLALNGMTVLPVLFGMGAFIFFLVFRIFQNARYAADNTQYIFTQNAIQIRNAAKPFVEYKDIWILHHKKDPFAKLFGVDVVVAEQQGPEEEIWAKTPETAL